MAILVHVEKLWLSGSPLPSLSMNCGYQSEILGTDYLSIFCNKWKVLILILSSADNFCKQFGPRSGRTKCWAWSGNKLLDTLMVFLKEFFEKVDFEKNQRTTKSMKNFPGGKELNIPGLEPALQLGTFWPASHPNHQIFSCFLGHHQFLAGYQL